MDLRLCINRAENELKLSGIIFTISEDMKIQADVFDIKDPETYYSSVISHCYYCIFYAAKAYLLNKGIRINAPREHKKAYEEFKKFVDSGELDVELLKIYHEAIIRADALLGILREEKQKRGKFTYRTLPQANKEPAKDSIAHAKTFFQHINALCNPD